MTSTDTARLAEGPPPEWPTALSCLSGAGDDQTVLEDHDAGELTALDESECWNLVAGLEIGRIAVATAGRGPLVVPVNYVVDRDAIVFRSDEGDKLDALLVAGAQASFQVDFLDPAHHTGWSVLISGVVEEVDLADVGHLTLRPWAEGPKRHWLRLRPMVVTGRHLHLPPFVVDDRGYL